MKLICFKTLLLTWLWFHVSFVSTLKAVTKVHPSEISKEKSKLSFKNYSSACGGAKKCPEKSSENVTANVEEKKTTPEWYPRSGTSDFQYLNLPSSNKGSAPPCNRPAQCEPLLVNVSTCFGASLSHRLTSVDLLGANATQSQAQRDLLRWQSSLKNIPKCWAMIQTLLCAVYMPRCENGVVDLPSRDMCRAVRGPCRVVEQTIGWPTFLRCDSETNFPTQCKAEPRELRFNTPGKCPPFLTPTDVTRHWYDGWDGCGLQCHDPLYTDEERSDVRILIQVAGTICLLCSLFTVLTFLIDWKCANKYPALIIFYINGCFLMITIGWMAQFTAGARDDIVCRKDGILRKSEPSWGENWSCIIDFIFIYYFMMAASIWSVILCYSWYMSFQALGKIRDAINAKAAYFHLVAWSIPLVLTITILALTVVDGSSLNGVCFVGYEDPYVRIGFVLVPISGCAVTSSYFVIKGLIVLIKLKLGTDDIISEKANSKIRETIARLVTFVAAIFVIIIITFACHCYEYSGQAGWDSALRRHIMCLSNLTLPQVEDDADVEKTCQLEFRPSVLATQVQNIALFGIGAFMSTWIWTQSTIETWKRFLKRVFKQATNEPVKLAKHKMIAKAFAKRKDINGGRMSFSFQSTHDDPLGMNFDLNSAASHEISSNWHAVLPKFIARRGAFDCGKTGRRNSSASEQSQQVTATDTQETRRQSLDSQVSFHMSEQERRQYLANARQQRRKRKKETKRKSRNSRVVSMMGVANLNHPRRGSDTSQHSDFGHLIPHHLLPSIDQSATAGNHVITDISSFDPSRVPFRVHPLRLDKDMCNLTVEPARISNHVIAENGTMPSLEDDDESTSTESSTSDSEAEREQLLEDELSNCILTRAGIDSQSNFEMTSLGSNNSHQNLKNKSPTETSLHDADSTIVDMNMDDDNRDSLSS